MNCSQLVKKIEQAKPTPDPKDVVRVASLICNQVSDLSQLENQELFENIWDDVNLRLQAATDQHAAVAAEISELTHSDPATFTQDQIWILIRAIKVQSQVLRLYVGDSAPAIS